MNDFQVILLAGQPDKRYLRIFDEWDEPGSEEALFTVLRCDTLGEGYQTIQTLIEDYWPDLIVLFTDTLLENGENIYGFCHWLRQQNLSNRPVVVVQSQGSVEERIQYLTQGADDIWGEDLSEEEFKVRLLVHLRRNLEMGLNELTQLPGRHFTQALIQRRLNQQKITQKRLNQQKMTEGKADEQIQQPIALITIELDQFDVYSEIYGDLPTRQVLKTLVALLGQLVMLPDVISHPETNQFIVLSHPDKAEKIANILCRQFETVSPNFYAEKERKQGYMVSVTADQVSRRVPLLNLSIGIASSTHLHPVSSFTVLFNVARQMQSLARMSPGSGWQSDRLRLSGEAAPASPQRIGILVLESDAALAYLLQATLKMEGYDVEVLSNVADARLRFKERLQDQDSSVLKLVIMDALVNEQESGLVLAEEINRHTPPVSMICISSLHNRQQVLQAGVDIYLPKPFELSTLFSWIQRLLREKG